MRPVLRNVGAVLAGFGIWVAAMGTPTAIAQWAGMSCQTCDPRHSSLDDYFNEKRMNDEIWQQRVEIEQQRKRLDDLRKQRSEQEGLDAFRGLGDDYPP
jgi:hypothetical protein